MSLRRILMVLVLVGGSRTRASGFSARPYNGYFFKILKAQDAHAPGGARKYRANMWSMAWNFRQAKYRKEWSRTSVRSSPLGSFPTAKYDLRPIYQMIPSFYPLNR